MKLWHTEGASNATLATTLDLLCTQKPQDHPWNPNISKGQKQPLTFQKDHLLDLFLVVLSSSLLTGQQTTYTLKPSIILSAVANSELERAQSDCIIINRKGTRS